MRGILMSCVVGLVLACFVSQVKAMDYPSMTIPNSMGVQLKRTNTSVEDLDKIAALGLKFVRKGFYWTSFEKKKGEYTFEEYDKFVKQCEDRGLIILGCLFSHNKLYGKVHEPAGREGFANFAAAVAKHYKGKPIFWEIWNEPNICTFWGRHGKHNSKSFAQEYYELVKATAAKMKAANPECKVMAGSVSNFWSASQNWMLMIFKMGVLQTGIDSWSIHPYTSKCPEGHVKAYEWTRKMMVKRGGLKKAIPLINSERGYPLGKKEGYAGGKANMAKEYQAWHVVRQYMIDLMCDIRMSNWYEWSGNESFSMYSPKEVLPAYTATKVMIEQLKGYNFDKRIEMEGEWDYALQFKNKAGNIKMVVWTAPVDMGTPDKIVDHEAKIPVGVTGKLGVVSLYGDKSKVVVKDGKIAMKLTGAPQYVAVK